MERIRSNKIKRLYIDSRVRDKSVKKKVELEYKKRIV